MRILFLLTFLFINLTLSAQLYCPPLSGKVGDPKNIHVSAGFGVNRMFGDINDKSSIGTAGYLKVEYTLKKGIAVGIEGQNGKLISKGTRPLDSRFVTNKYMAGGLAVSVYPVQLFKEKSYTRPRFSTLLIESLFVEVGAYGVINNYEDVYRDLNAPSTYGPIYEIDVNGNPIFTERSKTAILPSVAAGLGIPLHSTHGKNGNFFSLLPRIQMNFGDNDNLDGYVPRDGNLNYIPGKNDMFVYLSLGVKYSF